MLGTDDSQVRSVLARMPAEDRAVSRERDSARPGAVAG